MLTEVGDVALVFPNDTAIVRAADLPPELLSSIVEPGAGGLGAIETAAGTPDEGASDSLTVVGGFEGPEPEGAPTLPAGVAPLVLGAAPFAAGDPEDAGPDPGVARHGVGRRYQLACSRSE